MAELLILLSPVGTRPAGSVSVVKPDGWGWSELERTGFGIVRTPETVEAAENRWLSAAIPHAVLAAAIGERNRYQRAVAKALDDGAADAAAMPEGSLYFGRALVARSNAVPPEDATSMVRSQDWPGRKRRLRLTQLRLVSAALAKTLDPNQKIELSEIPVLDSTTLDAHAADIASLKVV